MKIGVTKCLSISARHASFDPGGSCSSLFNFQTTCDTAMPATNWWEKGNFFTQFPVSWLEPAYLQIAILGSLRHPRWCGGTARS